MTTHAIVVFQPAPGARYSLSAAAHLAGVPRRTLLIYCRAGLVQPELQPPYGMMTFTEEAILTVRHIERARAGYGLDPAWVRVLRELGAQVERLRAELRFWRGH